MKNIAMTASVIVGAPSVEPLANKYGMVCVLVGFQPILQAIDF